MTTYCPHCDKEIETEIHRAWVQEWDDSDGDYPIYLDFICPECGAEIDIGIEMKPIFSVLRKAER